MNARSRLRGIFPWLLLTAAAFAAYWPALGGGFIWDDDAHVTRVDLRSWHGLVRIWGELGATQQYYPVLHSAFWLEHRLWGDAALGYHIVNVGLHALAAGLFVLTLRRLGYGRSAWLAGLIFALHPVCVESVAWISEQKNTLSTVFYLLAGLAYWRFAEGRAGPPGKRVTGTKGYYVLATLFFVLALLSKSVTATLPAALLLVLWWKNKKLFWKHDVLPLLPWFVLGAGVGLLTAWVERMFIGAQGAAFDLTLGERVLLAGRAAWFYLGKLLWPADLMFVYPRWAMKSGAAGWVLFPAAALALLAGLGVLARRRPEARGALVAWLFFLGSLFPALGFFNVYPFVFSYVADHFQYLASLGVIAAVAAGWERWASGGPGAGRAARAAALVVLAGLGLMTWGQSRTYRDVETLYRTTLRRNPNAWLAHLNLGSILVEKGDVTEGVSHYFEALRLNPDYPDARFNLGKTLLQLGRAAEAIPQFSAAIRLNPGDAESHNNLGVALASTGRVPEAAVEFRAAVRLRPSYAQAHNNLGNELAGEQRPEAAIAEYLLALRADPNFAEAHNNLGLVLVRQGRRREAEAEFAEALRLKPEYADARQNLQQVRKELR